MLELLTTKINCMKRIVLVLCLAIGFNCATFAQSFTVKKGSKLIYQIETKSEKYLFKIKVIETEPTLKFSYVMTSKDEKKGSVSISPEAMESSNNLVNYFANGERVLNDATVIWISKAVWESICVAGNDDPISIKFDNAQNPTVFEMVVPQRQELKINGKVVNCKVSEIVEAYWDEVQQDRVEDKRLTVLENWNNPLIISMDIGFWVKLIEAKNVVLEKD
jgi:hypothetical protein